MASYFMGKAVEKINRDGKNLTALIQNGVTKWTGEEVIELSLTYTTDAGTFKEVFETINDFTTFIANNQNSMHTQIIAFNNRTDLGSYFFLSTFQSYRPSKNTKIDFSKFNAIECTGMSSFLNQVNIASDNITEFKMPYNTENFTFMTNFSYNCRNMQVDFSNNLFLKCTDFRNICSYNKVIQSVVLNSPNPLSMFLNAMFAECPAITMIDFSNFNVAATTVQTATTYNVFNKSDLVGRNAFAMDSAQAQKLNSMKSLAASIVFVVKPAAALMSLGIQPLGNIEDEQQQLNDLGVVN